MKISAKGASKPLFHSYLIVLFYDLDCHILEFWPSVSCWSILWVLQDVTALICMSLMGFSAWFTIGLRGYLKSCNFFHWLHCTPKFKDTAFSIAVYIQDRLEMKLGPRKPLFHSYLIVLFYDLDCHILEF